MIDNNYNFDNRDIDQLYQIYCCEPVWSGNLISKNSTSKLKEIGFIDYDFIYATITEIGISFILSNIEHIENQFGKRCIRQVR